MKTIQYLTAPGQLDLAPCGTVTTFHPHRIAVKKLERPVGNQPSRLPRRAAEQQANV